MCAPELLAQDLSNKVYIVTGGNSGVGLATIRQLAMQKAAVVLASRRVKEGEAAKAALAKEGLPGSIEVMELDLADLASVRRFAAAFIAAHPRLDGLVNNAGVMNTPRGKTKDGFETQIGTNHLGHYLLTELLLPVLKKSAPSRIISLSSSYHAHALGRPGRIVLDDLHFERRPYDGWAAYAQSKLANLLHARALATRLAGSGVTAVSVHPGWVRTNLVRSTMPRWVQDYVLRLFLRAYGMIEPSEGAQTSLYCLLSPEVPKHAGAYFSQTGLYKNKADRKGGWPLRSPNPQAHDDALATALDEASRRAVGLGT
jgi:NAD(P)-dependent dehydrogenase (short-subunit alcohol dehydrogenase family)